MVFGDPFVQTFTCSNVTFVQCSVFSHNESYPASQLWWGAHLLRFSEGRVVLLQFDYAFAQFFSLLIFGMLLYVGGPVQ